MKKYICLLLILTVIFSLTACSKNKNQTPTKPTTTPRESNPTQIEPTENNGIRENGTFPNDKSVLTNQEYDYYRTKTIKAVLELDMRTLKELLKKDDYELFERIYADEEFRNMYKKTVGEIIYLQDSDAFVAKDVNYVFAKWYTDQWNNNAEIENEVTFLSRDEIDFIYEKYYKDAPYTTANAGQFSTTISDGYLLFGITSIFQNILVYNINDLDPNRHHSSDNADTYAHLIFGDNGEHLSLGYDYINSIVPMWELVYNFDIDTMIKYVDENPAFLSNYEKNLCDKYYRNPQYRKTIENWVSENCEIYRELNGGYVFIKAYLEPDVRRSFYPYSLYTTEEQQSIKHLNLIVESPYGIKHEWRPFEEIIKIMENLELFNE